MQYFYIKQNAVLPTLRVELIEDGRNDFRKFHEAIQGADVTFTMKNADINVTKVAKGTCYLQKKEDTSCTEQYVICYDWKKRDTKDSGEFIGTFDIEFGNQLTSDTETYPSGTLLIPIREELRIVILSSTKNPH